MAQRDCLPFLSNTFIFTSGDFNPHGLDERFDLRWDEQGVSWESSSRTESPLEIAHNFIVLENDARGDRVWKIVETVLIWFESFFLWIIFYSIFSRDQKRFVFDTDYRSALQETVKNLFLTVTTRTLYKSCKLFDDENQLKVCLTSFIFVVIWVYYFLPIIYMPTQKGFSYTKVKDQTHDMLKTLKVFTDDGLELTTIDQKVFYLVKFYEKSAWMSNR